jgi:3beta-hydroxy-delta5-steroid dehydrogenase/steroid delta-isomerase
VLVTGGSGFVGKNFVKTLLNKGFKVRSFDLAPSDLEHENLECIEGNICDNELVEKIVEGIDTVFHTAAIIGLKGGNAVTKEYRDQSYSINIEGTKNLLKALRKAVAHALFTHPAIVSSLEANHSTMPQKTHLIPLASMNCIPKLK